MSKTLKDIGVCLVIMVASAVIYWDSLSLRVRTYDPLGSGTMPRMVATGIIILCLVAIVQAIFERNARRRPAPVGEDDDFERRPWLAVTIFGFLVVSGILILLQVPFGITGSLLVFASTVLIKKGERAIILPAAALSLVFGVGLSYLFGAVFNVDLP